MIGAVKAHVYPSLAKLSHAHYDRVFASLQLITIQSWQELHKDKDGLSRQPEPRRPRADIRISLVTLQVPL